MKIGRSLVGVRTKSILSYRSPAAIRHSDTLVSEMLGYAFKHDPNSSLGNSGFRLAAKKKPRKMRGFIDGL